MALQIDVVDNPATQAIDIYIYEELPGGNLRLGLPMILTLEEKEMGIVSEPTLRLPRRIAENLFRALAEKLDRLGIKTDSDAHREGEIKAMRYHLEDMRRIALRGIVKVKE